MDDGPATERCACTRQRCMGHTSSRLFGSFLGPLAHADCHRTRQHALVLQRLHGGQLHEILVVSRGGRSQSLLGNPSERRWMSLARRTGWRIVGLLSGTNATRQKRMFSGCARQGSLRVMPSRASRRLKAASLERVRSRSGAATSLLSRDPGQHRSYPLPPSLACNLLRPSAGRTQLLLATRVDLEVLRARLANAVADA
jgi:hypothetical protein